MLSFHLYQAFCNGSTAELYPNENKTKLVSFDSLQKPVSDKLEVNDVTIKVDNTSKVATANTNSSEKIEGVYELASDVDGNSKITAADARKILRISAGLEKHKILR